jgi:hypothetical protein
MANGISQGTVQGSLRPLHLLSRARSGWLALSARPAVLCLLLAAVAALSLARQWDGRILWDPDSLMYQSQTLELRGTDAQTARHEVFFGPLGAWARSLDADQAGEPRRVTDRHWVDYASRFYRRRWLLPALAAATYPVLGERSLHTWSLLGYVAIAPLLFLLLLRRFRPSTSVAVTLGCLALGPLRDWSVIPLTDSWAVALMLGSLLAGLAVIERGVRWLPAWVALMLALSITRDTAFVVVAAAVGLAVLLRTRRSVALAGTAMLASLPAPLIFGADARGQLAFVASDRTVPHDTSWGFILGHYGRVVRDMLGSYADYATAAPLVVLAFVAGVALLYALGDRRDPLIGLLWTLPLGYLALLALGPTFSRFRYELVLMPCVAAGFALGVEAVRRRLPWSLEAAPQPVAS